MPDFSEGTAIWIPFFLGVVVTTLNLAIRNGLVLVEWLQLAAVVWQRDSLGIMVPSRFSESQISVAPGVERRCLSRLGFEAGLGRGIRVTARGRYLRKLVECLRLVVKVADFFRHAPTLCKLLPRLNRNSPPHRLITFPIFLKFPYILVFQINYMLAFLKLYLLLKLISDATAATAQRLSVLILVTIVLIMFTFIIGLIVVNYLIVLVLVHVILAIWLHLIE